MTQAPPLGAVALQRIPAWGSSVLPGTVSVCACFWSEQVEMWPTFQSGPAGGGWGWRGGRAGLPMREWPKVSQGTLYRLLCLSFPMCPGLRRLMGVGVPGGR